ncbi:hypothetical protein I302_106185 [Kwoniella bestiolae CBS 10118]|uniref:Uncharacterized protein n=1 Tax=Kwoniella bestiolae CBS 10118 TaxID=1296100 RepID=A0A1B9G369_9TREE|nr:hypothetical protein I302_05309 [Kwoniella bestiolae CBS 10118]OCF25489.1 hypothetical protein I302_05309 [Kwoniella bestiolae CBS 10118]
MSTVYYQKLTTHKSGGAPSRTSSVFRRDTDITYNSPGMDADTQSVVLSSVWTTPEGDYIILHRASLNALTGSMSGRPETVKQEAQAQSRASLIGSAKVWDTKTAELSNILAAHGQGGVSICQAQEQEGWHQYTAHRSIVQAQQVSPDTIKQVSGLSFGPGTNCSVGEDVPETAHRGYRYRKIPTQN